MDFRYKDENEWNASNEKIIGMRKARVSMFWLKLVFSCFIIFTGLATKYVIDESISDYDEEFYYIIGFGLLFITTLTFHLFRYKYLMAKYKD
jgi:hypothetical protein